MNTQDKNAEHREAIRSLYRSAPDREWHRLERHRTEYAVTLRALDAHLPAPPAKILDCGGGPGRYAIELARRGYQVTLFDLSSELLNLARQHATEAGVTLANYESGTATDLSRFADASFDAVLCMGPLYHLLEGQARRRALGELYRVAGSGAPVFAAFIARYAGHQDAAANYPENLVENPDVYEIIEETGQLPPRADGTPGFVAYFAHPAEVQPMCREVGLEVLHVLGVEGVVSAHEEKVNALEDEAWERWVDVNYRIAHDPYILSGVQHILAVCRKPVWRDVLRRVAARLNDVAIDYAVVGGTALALHDLPVRVNDLDIEITSVDDLDLVRETFAEHIVKPIEYRQEADVRSHFGALSIDGIQVEIMAGLEWRRGQRWVPTFLSTREQVDLDGTPVNVLSLEEEALATLRRGRLKRAGLALPHCDPSRFQDLLQQAQRDRAL